MQFRNLTPFDALLFPAYTQGPKMAQVFVMKVGYRLRPTGSGRFELDVLDKDPLPLCLADEFQGEPGTSSIREESDLAPLKLFNADVIVRGHAYAPGGQPATQWNTRLRLSKRLPSAPMPEPDIEPPRPLAPNMSLSPEQHLRWRQDLERARAAIVPPPTHETLIDKTLCIHGPRVFEKKVTSAWAGLFRKPKSTAQIVIGKAAPTLSVPLDWEHTWGGASRVPNPAREQDAQAPEFLLNEVCFSNPLGRGWFEKRHLELALQAQLPSPIENQPAPQIEYPDTTVTAPVFASHPEPPLDAAQMAEVAAEYGMRPAGFGFVGRAWAPRLALAGSFDESWLANRWPRMPLSFKPEYWSGAPEDQRLDQELPDNARIELWNLVPPEHADSDGRVVIDLPGHRVFLLLRLNNGVPLPVRISADTMVIDTDALTLSLTYRTELRSKAPASIRVAEARFEIDPALPLVQMPMPTVAETKTV